MLKAIIFDMDGVLINTEPLHYEMWKRTFRNHGLIITYDKYENCIGSTTDYLMELILKNYGKDFREHISIRAEAAQIKNDMIKEQGFPRIAGVTEVIKRLHKEGYLLAVASSSSNHYIKEAMKTLNIESFFTLLFSGENVINPKPAPDIFLKVAEKLMVLPEECLVIEDSTNGCMAAKRAGMRCVGYRNPDSGNQNLSTSIRIIDNWETLDRDFVKSLSDVF